MNYLDWTLILIYLAGMIGLSVYLGQGQKTNEDYYLGGKKMKWWAIGLSTMATQCSTNSLLGAPAFVALAAGGGLVWLQYELAVPLAMIFLMIFVLPFYRKANVISIYEYLEKRFDVVTRTVLSIMFQFMRAFSTGVTVFGISKVLEKLVGLPFWGAVLVLGVVTIVYDSIGGMLAVVYSDVIQMAVLYGGIIIAIGYALYLVGGLGAVWENFEAARQTGLDFSTWGFSEGGTFAFWPMLIGGFFLYVSYYGCDQTQVQRELSAASEDETNLSLSLNGFIRFPLVLTYCFLGVCIAAFIKLNPSFLASLPLKDNGAPEINMAVPLFVLQHLPHGVIGLIMIALFAAAMSSLDSTINSLSALTMRDIYQRFFDADPSERKEFILGKLFTVFWGVLCCGFSFYVSAIADTIIESVNKIGSALFGPILGVFVLGILVKRANQQGAIFGLAAGLLLNIYLWLFVPQVSWLWWNVLGCLVTVGVGFLLSLPFSRPDPESIKTLVFSREFNASVKYRINWKPVYWVLGVYAVLMIGIIALF